MNSMTDAISQIEAAEDARFAAVLTADTSLLNGLFHEKLSYVHSSGVIDTKRSYIDGVADGRWVYVDANRSDQMITIEGDVGLVFNRLKLKLLANGSPKDVDARTLSIWLKAAEGWQLIAVQSGGKPE